MAGRYQGQGRDRLVGTIDRDQVLRLWKVVTGAVPRRYDTVRCVYPVYYNPILVEVCCESAGLVACVFLASVVALAGWVIVSQANAKNCNQSSGTPAAHVQEPTQHVPLARDGIFWDTARLSDAIGLFFWR